MTFSTRLYRYLCFSSPNSLSAHFPRRSPYIPLAEGHGRCIFLHIERDHGSSYSAKAQGFSFQGANGIIPIVNYSTFFHNYNRKKRYNYGFQNICRKLSYPAAHPKNISSTNAIDVIQVKTVIAFFIIFIPPP